MVGGGRARARDRSRGGPHHGYAWQRLDAAAAYEGEVGAGATTWTDLTGHGHTITWGAGAEQPTYSAALFGGAGGYDFDGGDHGHLNTFAAARSGTDQPWSLAMVVVADTIVGNDALVCLSHSTVGTREDLRYLLNGAPSTFRRDDGAVQSGGVAAGVGFTAGTAYVLVASFAGTAVTYYRGLTAAAPVATDVGSVTFDLCTVAARDLAGVHSDHFDGKVGALSLYTRALTAVEANALARDYGARYGVSV